MSYRNVTPLDKNLIFAEHFNDEQSVRKNGALRFPDGDIPSISQGKLLSSAAVNEQLNIKYNFAAGREVSFRFKCRVNDVTPPSGRYFLDWRAGSASDATYITWSTPGTIAITNFSSSNAYVNGIDTMDISSLEGEWIDVIVVGVFQDPVSLASIGRWGLGATNSEIDFDFIEVYNKILTDEEITNLYNDARYVLPNLEHEEQLGAENLTKVENFTADTWSAIGAEWSVSNGLLNYTTNANSTITQAIPADTFAVGDLVRIEVEVQGLTSGNAIVRVCDLGGSIMFPVDITMGNERVVAYKRITSITTPGGLGFRGISSSGSAYSVSYFSVKKVVVEPTSKILHVTAKNGVVQNLLAGDVSEYVVNTRNFASWINANDWIQNIDGSATCPDGVPTSTLSIHTLLVAEEAKYQVIVKLRDVTDNGGYLRVYVGDNDFTDFFSSDGDGWFTGYLDQVNDTGDTSINLQGRSNWIGTIEQLIINIVIPEPVVTDVEVVKDSPGRVPRFNGSSSKIDCGDYNDLTGDITILTWMRYVEDEDEIANLRAIMISNNQLGFGIRDTDMLTASRNGFANAGRTGNNVLIKYGWNQVAMVSKADGITDFYMNGEDKTDISDCGTPAAGTGNITIGEIPTGGAREWEGDIPEVIVLDGLLTAEEISAYYTSTKHKYGK